MTSRNRDNPSIYNRYSLQPLRILVSGSSGFVGKDLIPFLRDGGHEVVRLFRSHNRQADDAIYWNPKTGEIQKEDFEGFDAIIHLAGESISKFPWTKKQKKRVFLSRSCDTWLLSQVLIRLYRPPKCVICASAIGIYGDRKEEILTEESSLGSGFLPDVCKKWEEASEAIENRGSRVIHARFAHILSSSGGILQKFIQVYKWGLGGKLGDGEQFISWIGMDDLLGALYHALMVEKLEGPVNFSSPQALKQKEFSKILATFLKKKTWINIPAGFLRFFLGDMANELFLSSARVYPQKLLDTGYLFQDLSLEQVLYQRDSRIDIKRSLI